MDLIKVLRSRIDELPPGEHVSGLRAVLQHIEVAASHMARGVSQHDDTAFTDAIYRTNQAFEGSLKEAYRVLAGKDPLRVRPFDIESYFQDNSVLRARVLSQFSNYRTEWRNPSTHDYRLDFDEDEALLAIVSVSAFAVVLADQISEKLAFEATKASGPQGSTTMGKPLLDTVTGLVEGFQIPEIAYSSDGRVNPSKLVGALAGYMSSALPAAKVDIEPRLTLTQRPDILLQLGDEALIVEVKRNYTAGGALNRANLVARASRYFVTSNVKNVLVYVYPDVNGTDLVQDEESFPVVNALVRILRPVK